MKKILLDTNAYSKFMNGDEKVLEVIGESERIFFSVIVLAELFYGFRAGSIEKKNNDYLKTFLKKTSVSILEASMETARIFSEIKYSLKKSGTPIPINDVWIASHCVESGAELITYDYHFLKISGLRVWDGLR